MKRDARNERIEHLKRCIEQVMRISGMTADTAGETEILVEKDHSGLPGDVVITLTTPARTERWKRNLNGWYIHATELRQ
jgi:hypothetical protein